MRIILFFGALLMISFVVYGQDVVSLETNTPIINAGNILRLESVATIDFMENSDLAGEFDSGWFEVNADGTLFSTVNNTDEVVIWDDSGAIVMRYASEFEGDTIDIAFSSIQNNVYSLHKTVDGVEVISWDSVNDTLTSQLFIVAGIPVDLWVDEDDVAWGEFLDDESFVLRLDDDGIQIPNAPENDPHAFVRIGRVEPPLAVTSSLDGNVTLWDMATGEVLSQTQLTDNTAVFGQINTPVTHLAWRDPASNGLHLLDFETGRDQLIANLNGTYLQFYALSQSADTIIGINSDDAPIVVAWDVETSTYYNLGAYRDCERVPDMARLTDDGTTLVIGCDSGLDIWRVVDE